MPTTILGKVWINPRGEWQQGTYARLDLVSYQGNSFISMADNNTAQLTDATKWMVIAYKGAKGDTGKTAKFESGTGTSLASDAQPTVEVSQTGTDSEGNPVYSLSVGVPKGMKGDTGAPPVFETGTVTTGQPGTDVQFSIVPNGLSVDGVQKYKVNVTIPRGAAGEGSGNVKVTEAGLVAGKKYLFVPGGNGSPEGTMVEFNLADYLPAGYEILLAKKEEDNGN